MHFFAVACFGVGRLMLPRPTTRGLRLSLALLATAVAIIWPIIRSEGVRAVFFPYLAPSPKVDRGLLAGAFRDGGKGGGGGGGEAGAGERKEDGGGAGARTTTAVMATRRGGRSGGPRPLLRGEGETGSFTIFLG
jgi:hypothetical protein